MRKSCRFAVVAPLFALFALPPAFAEEAPAQVESSLLNLASGLPRTPEQEAMKIEKALLRFRVDPAKKELVGDATLTIRAQAPLARLVIDLDARFAIERVEVDGKAFKSNRYRNPEGRLEVDLPRKLAAGRSLDLRIRYAGTPREALVAPWDGGFVWSTAPTGEPWIATAVQGEGCDLFWPCIDHPLAEPGEVEQEITVPSPLVAAGNGIALGMTESDGWRTYRWRTRDPNTYGIALNIGPYGHLHLDYASRYGNTIPVDFWHLASRAEQAKKLFEEFPKILDFYEQVIGPYPFGGEKMGVVETPHLGMEHQTINAYGNEYKLDEYGFDWLLHHEFAHEWFGNQMTNDDWDHMWLHEGFGGYMQPLYTQWLHGEMPYLARLFNTRKQGLRNRVPIVSGKTQCEHIAYSPDHGPGSDIYAKGSLVLHTLRGTIGDAAFFDATRRLVYGRPDPKPGNFETRTASTRDFQRAVNEATGRDYAWFFDVYLYSAALPELVVERDATGLDLSWKAPGNLPFPMPVELRVNGDLVVADLASGKARVAATRDDIVVVDPASKLLKVEPHLDAWRATQEPRKTRRQRPVDPADPCLSGS
jgi:aminopeptidase N